MIKRIFNFAISVGLIAGSVAIAMSISGPHHNNTPSPPPLPQPTLVFVVPGQPCPVPGTTNWTAPPQNAMAECDATAHGGVWEILTNYPPQQ